MKEYFKFEDFLFENVFGDAKEMIAQAAARAANKKLNELIESWPKMMVKKDSYIGWLANEQGFKDGPGEYVGYLAFIEEIKKECVKHEPVQQIWVDGSLSNYFRCRHCGVELQATWSAKK